MGCSGPSGSARPSMVVTLAPSHWSASAVQDLAAMPSMCTTQAPHCEVSQPTWVPVSRRSSRRNCTSKVRASTSPLTGLPFTVMDTLGMGLLRSGPKALFSRHPLRAAVARTRNRADFVPDAPWNWFKSGPPPPAGSRDSEFKSRRNAARHASTRRNRGGEILEKVVGDLLGGAVDQALAELGELAADLRLDVVGEQRAAVLFGERDRRTAFGKTGDAALAFARYPIAIGWIEVGKVHAAFEARLHRADLGGGDRLEFGVGGFVEFLAARDAGLEHLGIVELGVDDLAARRQLDLARHDHRHCR